jgi:hypothetical protein
MGNGGMSGYGSRGTVGTEQKWKQNQRIREEIRAEEGTYIAVVVE